MCLAWLLAGKKMHIARIGSRSRRGCQHQFEFSGVVQRTGQLTEDLQAWT